METKTKKPKKDKEAKGAENWPSFLLVNKKAKNIVCFTFWTAKYHFRGKKDNENRQR